MGKISLRLLYYNLHEGKMNLSSHMCHDKNMFNEMDCRFNTLRPRQNYRHFADDIIKCIFLNGNVWISLKISPKFVPKVRVINIPALVQIMAWRRPGDKPLSAPMTVSLPTHTGVTRPQWAKIEQNVCMCRVSHALLCNLKCCFSFDIVSHLPNICAPLFNLCPC